MAQLVKMPVGESGTILVEVPDEEGIRQVGAAEGVIDALGKAFDKTIQYLIIENCKTLSKAFQALQEQTPAPRKASVEFGLQVTAEGNIYVVKSSGEASFKINFEWEL